MPSIRCVEMPGETIQGALDQFSSQMTKVGVTRADLISVHSQPINNAVKTLSSQSTSQPKVIVTIFYWSGV